MTVQIAGLILPTTWSLGTETETINDLVEHTSVDIPGDALQEKIVHITATEVVVVGTPGSLWAWIELSPYLSTTSTAYFAAIGGGGGTRTPLSPVIEAPTGVTLTVHTFIIPWTIHSSYARLVIQMPVAATPTTAYWVVQALIGGKS